MSASTGRCCRLRRRGLLAEEDMIELANGCICCTVADDFLPTMQTLLDRPEPPDHIVIETSGLALPQPLVRAFNWPEIDPRHRRWRGHGGRRRRRGRPLRRRCERSPGSAQPIRCSITTARSANCSRISSRCADLVVLNKTDLVDDAALVADRKPISPHSMRRREGRPCCSRRRGCQHRCSACRPLRRTTSEARPSHHRRRRRPRP